MIQEVPILRSPNNTIMCKPTFFTVLDITADNYQDFLKELDDYDYDIASTVALFFFGIRHDITYVSAYINIDWEFVINIFKNHCENFEIIYGDNDMLSCKWYKNDDN